MSLLYLIAGIATATLCQMFLQQQPAYAFVLGVIVGAFVTMVEKRGGRE